MFKNRIRQVRVIGLWLLFFMITITTLLLFTGIADAGTNLKRFQSIAEVTIQKGQTENYYSSNCYISGSRSASGERSTLLEWDIRSLPRNSRITKATIELQVIQASRDTFNVYDLKRDWEETEATWRSAKDRIDWQYSGASGFLDRGSKAVGVLWSRKTGTAKINLDLDLVQKWLIYPSGNFGVIIAAKNPNASDTIGFQCYDSNIAYRRPILEIQYRN